MDDTDVELELVGTGELALLEQDRQAARDYARESLSPATRRAYQTDVDAFVSWCRGRGVQALPAEADSSDSRPFRPVELYSKGGVHGGEGSWACRLPVVDAFEITRINAPTRSSTYQDDVNGVLMVGKSWSG